MISINLSVEAILGIISIIGSISYVVFVTGKTKQRIEELENKTSNTESEVKDLRNKLSEHLNEFNFLKGSIVSSNVSVDKLSMSNSPRRLNKEGLKVLKDSKIEEITDSHYDTILEDVRSQKPENAYQAQEAVFVAVANLIENESIRNFVEEGAFLSGYTPKDVLFVGALNIRDKIIEDLGMKTEDIDKCAPDK